MKDFMNKVFDKHEVEEVYRDYIMDDSKHLPQDAYLWDWDKVLIDLNEKLEFDNEYMLKIYEMLMKTNYFRSFTDFLHAKFDDDKYQNLEAYKLAIPKAIELLTKAGNKDLFDIYYRMVDATSLYSEGIAEYMNENHSKKEIIKYCSKYNLDYSINQLYLDLYKLDSNSFGDFIINTLRNSTELSTHLTEYLPLIKEQNTLKELILLALEDALTQKYSIKANEVKILLSFFGNNLDKKFDKTLSSVSFKLNKQEERIYFLEHVMLWFKESNIDSSKGFLKKLKTFAFNLDPYFNIKELLGEKSISKDTALSEYEIPFNIYLRFLFGASEDWYNGDLKENSIKELKKYCKTDFDAFKEALLLNNNDIIINTVKDFYKNNKTGFNKLVVEMAPAATSKTMKKFIIGILEKDKENKDALLGLLKDKKTPSREIAVTILINWKLDDTKDIIAPLLKTEKNKAVKMLIEDYMATFKLETTDESDFFSKAEVLKRAKKEQISVYGMEKIPLMTWKEDNKDLVQYFTKYIIALLSKGDKVLKARPEAKKVISLLTDDSISKLINSVTDDYAKTSDWYLRAIPFTKEDKYLNNLKEYISKLIYSSRGAAAAKIVDVIAEFKTTKAIQLLDHLSLKKNAKDARVNRGAVAAMDAMAKEMNLTKEDLLDFIIPDFGFDKKGELSLDFGPRQFIVSLQSDLTMLIKDNNGKSYKNLPKVGKNDDAVIGAESTKLFKTIKKDLKKQVKLEKDRLERGFSESRFWKGENWLKLFVNNPIMRIFAMNLVWGTYKDGKLVESFRYLDDGTFSNINDDELNIKNSDSIALIHPVELSESQLSQWKEMLEDYEITQSFEQIHRPIFKFTDENKDKNTLDNFKGFMLGRFALRNGLFKSGWSRGSVEDAGCYYYYDKVYGDGTFVSLDFLGDYIGNYDDNKEVPIYDVKLSKNGKELKISEIPARLYSELYYELKKITDKGSGFNSDWEKAEW